MSTYEEECVAETLEDRIAYLEAVMQAQAVQLDKAGEAMARLQTYLRGKLTFEEQLEATPAFVLAKAIAANAAILLRQAAQPELPAWQTRTAPHSNVLPLRKRVHLDKQGQSRDLLTIPETLNDTKES